jgi:hypothetical protein
LEKTTNNVVDGVPFEKIPETEELICSITNSYKNNLLTKRVIVFPGKDGTIDSEIGVISELIQYDQKPLPARPWKYEEEELWDR